MSFHFDQYDKELLEPVWLHFQDGTKFPGRINLSKDDSRLQEGVWGEAAFITGMSGYQETLTDPSFLGQFIIFSSPHIGNYPSDSRVNQSSKPHAVGAIAKSFSPNDYLRDLDFPLISEVDTRALVMYLSQKETTHDPQTESAHKMVVTLSQEAPSKAEFIRKKLFCNDLARVSQRGPLVLIPGNNPIVVMNYGIKFGILDHLKKLDYPLVTLGVDATFDEIMSFKPRMVFLSNGPGDPGAYKPQIEVIKQLLKTDVPLRAICLGHQLIGLALGGKSYKMPFGHRGINHPVVCFETGKVMITSQNHGYALESDFLKKNKLTEKYYISYESLFDASVEGISSFDGQVKTVQFHPESCPGPTDAEVFFQEVGNDLRTFLDHKNLPSKKQASLALQESPKLKKINEFKVPYKKIMIIGSGPIKIGQASEFDYSGTQAAKALRSLGIDVVLLNSNPATIMTDRDLCYRTYIEPITIETVVKILQKEKVDAVLSTMGGQTALNLCVELETRGILSDFGVTLLGANAHTISLTEDREKFSEVVTELGHETGKRVVVKSENEALDMAGSFIGYPLIIRRNFALGGQGAAIIKTEDELREMFTSDLKFPITLEKSLHGYKEIELEVMVDKDKNGVIICSIENVDPCGVHTGDSITVAPAQTISDKTLQHLRDISLKIARRVGVVAGGANVQFAIHPENEDDIVVIEMNPRVSRSSALASKATGYPIAKISALLAVGLTLKDIMNDITQVSPVAFEPTLDYVAVKIPNFPFDKFPSSSRLLGPQMRSVGEVLAIGSTFNEAFFKALRSLEQGLELPYLTSKKSETKEYSKDDLIERLSTYQELSLLTVLEALRLKIGKGNIYKLSKISPWFIEQMNQIVYLEEKAKTKSPLQHPDFLYTLKQQGLADSHIAKICGSSEETVFQARLKHKIHPVYKAVDTCSGEFKAQTPYFYSTYQSHQEVTPFSANGEESIIILGSGPNRIGQGIEFDYSCVKAAETCREKKFRAILVNSNPETVSTDYDSSDRLFLSPLHPEDLFEITHFENPKGIIASFSGQTGIRLREQLERGHYIKAQKFPFLGPSLEILNLTEDRALFDQVIKKIGDLNKTKSVTIKGLDNLDSCIGEVGLPVIIRPSFVIGGDSMYVLRTRQDVHELSSSLAATVQNKSVDFLVETYIEKAHEYDVDLIRDKNGKILLCVCEHIEHAGVHSGDSGMICPPTALPAKLFGKLQKIASQIAHDLEIVGPLNIQLAVAIEKDEITCIEANPRGSRTLPFLSKAYNLNLPRLATLVLLGEALPDITLPKLKFFAVKQSTFPFDRFVQDDIILGPKMRSTGETMGVDRDKDIAVLKSYLGNYPKLRKVGNILFSINDRYKPLLLPYLKSLSKMGYKFFATEGTATYIRSQGLDCKIVNKLDQAKDNLLEVIKDSETVLVLNTPEDKGKSQSQGEMMRNSAILFGVPCFTRSENIIAVLEGLIGSKDQEEMPLALQELPYE